MFVAVSLAAPALAQETALPGLREAARVAPSDVQAQIALGRALIEAGRLAEAEAQMKTVVKLDKGSIEALYEARRVDIARDDYKRVRAGCRELSAKDPKHVLTHVCMARAFLVWRRASRAFEPIEAALAADPSHYEARLALADAKRIEGDFEAAKQAYEAVLAGRPNAADAHLGIALVHAVQNRPDLAVTALRKAYEAAPHDPDVQFELGRRAPPAEGVELLRKALAGRPGWAAARLELAIAQLRTGDAAGAEPTLQAILKQEPNNAPALAQHGVALVALGRVAEAEPKLKKALELMPIDYDASFALAQIYEQTARNEEALTQYRSAADLKRESPAALSAAARLALSLERPLLAGALLDKALERAPRSAEALALYGDALAARGDKGAAREHYQRALQGEGPLDRAGVQKRLAALK
jgi:tetratricopeptide (TPR) repeat protein